MRRRLFLNGGVLTALSLSRRLYGQTAAHPTTVSLDGEWRFAVDLGITERWFRTDFDDRGWRGIHSGQSWEENGIHHYGFGWYRKEISVPRELAGISPVLVLPPIPSDDDIWFNGEHIGGLRGEYKYDNWIPRSYTVPSSLVRYGQKNLIAARFWGGDITFIGAKSGLVKGPLAAEFDPCAPMIRAIGGPWTPVGKFDLSDAQHAMPFEIRFRLPADPAAAHLRCTLSDFLGNEFQTATAKLAPAAGGLCEAIVAIDGKTAHTIYLRGRFKANLSVADASGRVRSSDTRAFDHLSFRKRDQSALPALAARIDDTPFGTLKLVDEIDCATDVTRDPHPYLQSGFEKGQQRVTPGSPLAVEVHQILGRPARESENGWFAYRIGRGKLVPHANYLLRIEYPEDKPRYAPIEIQTGQNYIDIGWKNGVAPDDVYEPWPLSHRWEWYDVIIALDDETVGTGGTGTANAENGFWIYFMNKRIPNGYFAPWSGGPAVARIRLYEIDPERHSPKIQRPLGLPQRVLSFDWERQADHRPADLVRYAKLMGYSAISPLIIKWAFANYSDPLNGYETIAIDDRNYWARKAYDPASGEPASSPCPGRKSQHALYLEATRQWGIEYIPRFEWGGSLDLSREAWALDTDGQPMKPSRFATWGCNLLHPLTWEDLKRLIDHLVKPYAADNPQFTGVVWRARSGRLAISYGPRDVEMFATETGTPLPEGDARHLADWASGPMKARYETWWHARRAEFHRRLVQLLKSYRPDLALYYYNWDADKFSLVLPDVTMWAFLGEVAKPEPIGGMAAYRKNREQRKSLTSADYIQALHTGDFGSALGDLKRADIGLRPELYKNIPGIRLLGPVNALCYADKPDYVNYFQTADGLAVSNAVEYDEVDSRSINPKFEGNMVMPGGAPFSMAMELLAYFHGDARTLTYTVYTYGRGFAAAHRRFAQAFLALPAIESKIIDHADENVRVRAYPSPAGTYYGVAYKGYVAKKIRISLPEPGRRCAVTDLVRGATTDIAVSEGRLEFEIASGPMELHSFLVRDSLPTDHRLP